MRQENRFNSEYRHIIIYVDSDKNCYEYMVGKHVNLEIDIKLFSDYSI